MTKRQSILNHAEKHCASQGLRFTKKRRQILDVLLKKQKPLSAYELVDVYQGYFNESMPVMSAYRILDLLVEAKLVHKMYSTQKYLACTHIECEHGHDAMQFLICDSCERVQEVLIKKNVVKNLQDQSVENGFQLNTSALEIHGLCEKCQP